MTSEPQDIPAEEPDGGNLQVRFRGGPGLGNRPRLLNIKEESRPYYQSLGRRVMALRKLRGMTQVELARAIGISQQAVFAYEIGQRRISVLVLTKLAKIFSTSIEDMAGLSKPLRVPKGRLSPRCMRHAERLQALSKTQQRFVIRIIDVLESSNKTKH